MRRDICEVIRTRIMNELSGGRIPWKCPWDKTVGQPRNYDSNRPFRGINAFLFGMAPYKDPRWLPMSAIKRSQKGPKDKQIWIKRGEKHWPCVFWRPVSFTREDDQGEEQTISYVKPTYYLHFNVEQLDIPNLKPLKKVKDVASIGSCDEIVEGYVDGPQTVFSGSAASYTPVLDLVNMPPREAFLSSEELYSTWFHELVHSTGHKTRLDRPNFGKAWTSRHDYSQEELTAEMGAAMLCAIVGIEEAIIQNSIAYCQGWFSRLRTADPRFVVDAAQRAQHAVDRILGEEAEV